MMHVSTSVATAIRRTPARFMAHPIAGPPVGTGRTAAAPGAPGAALVTRTSPEPDGCVGETTESELGVRHEPLELDGCLFEEGYLVDSGCPAVFDDLTAVHDHVLDVGPGGEVDKLVNRHRKRPEMRFEGIDNDQI